MIQAKFGLNWPSGFRGEDFSKSLQMDDGRQVMAIAHMTLWVRWAKKESIPTLVFHVPLYTLLYLTELEIKDSTDTATSWPWSTPTN